MYTLLEALPFSLAYKGNKYSQFSVFILNSLKLAFLYIIIFNIILISATFV